MTPEEFILKNPVFTTRQYAQSRGLHIESASRYLNQQKKNNSIEQITRGLWAQPLHPYFSIYSIIPYLLKNEQGYISFLTALHIHGVISQIPQTITVATTGHTRQVRLKLLSVDFIQLKPSLMRFGIETVSGKTQYNLASPEKAFLDCLYISSRKGNRFSHFPELDESLLDRKKLKQYLLESKFPPMINKLIVLKV